jgi:hypothetical protein
MQVLSTSSGVRCEIVEHFEWAISKSGKYVAAIFHSDFKNRPLANLRSGSERRSGFGLIVEIAIAPHFPVIGKSG